MLVFSLTTDLFKCDRERESRRDDRKEVITKFLGLEGMERSYFAFLSQRAVNNLDVS